MRPRLAEESDFFELITSTPEQRDEEFTDTIDETQDPLLILMQREEQEEAEEKPVLKGTLHLRH